MHAKSWPIINARLFKIIFKHFYFTGVNVGYFYMKINITYYKRIDTILTMFPTTDEGTEMQLKILCLLYFGQNCLHLTFNPYFSSKIHYRNYEKLPNIAIFYACLNIAEKKNFIKKVCPATVYVDTHFLK